MLQMENVKDMAISSSFLAKAKIDSLLRRIDSIIDGFKADISKGKPTYEHVHVCFHSWCEVDNLLPK